MSLVILRWKVDSSPDGSLLIHRPAEGSYQARAVWAVQSAVRSALRIMILRFFVFMEFLGDWLLALDGDAPDGAWTRPHHSVKF